MAGFWCQFRAIIVPICTYAAESGPSMPQTSRIRAHFQPPRLCLKLRRNFMLGKEGTMKPAAEPVHEFEAPRDRLSRLRGAGLLINERPRLRLHAAAGAITTSSGRQSVRARSTLERITPTPAARRSTVCPQTR